MENKIPESLIPIQNQFVTLGNGGIPDEPMQRFYRASADLLPRHGQMQQLLLATLETRPEFKKSDSYFANVWGRAPQAVYRANNDLGYLEKPVAEWTEQGITEKTVYPDLQSGHTGRTERP